MILLTQVKGMTASWAAASCAAVACNVVVVVCEVNETVVARRTWTIRGGVAGGGAGGGESVWRDAARYTIRFEEL